MFLAIQHPVLVLRFMYIYVHISLGYTEDMKWTRKFFAQFEWYHKPISPMEESLLLPVHIDNTLSLFTKRLGIQFPPKAWKVVNGYLYMTSDYWKLLFQPAVVLLPILTFKNLRQAKDFWLKQVIPSYQMKIDRLSKINFGKKKSGELISLVFETTQIEGKLMAESLYVGVYAIIAEVLLKISYRLLVKDNNLLNYYELLVGFHNHGIEADSRLWQIAQQKDKKGREMLLRDWIGKYGYRIQDKDILYPTLGESGKTINSLLLLYQHITNPQDRVKKAVDRRKQREAIVENHVRLIPFAKTLLYKIIYTVQQYAQIRDSRPFYYQGNRIIRKILLALAKRISLPNPHSVFFLTFNELKLACEEKNINKLKELVSERKKLYEMRLLKQPPLEVEA